MLRGNTTISTSSMLRNTHLHIPYESSIARSDLCDIFEMEPVEFSILGVRGADVATAVRPHPNRRLQWPPLWPTKNKYKSKMAIGRMRNEEYGPRFAPLYFTPLHSTPIQARSDESVCVYLNRPRLELRSCDIFTRRQRTCASYVYGILVT